MVKIFKKSVIESLVPEIKEKLIYKRIKGKFFVFDNESLKEFEDFSDNLHNVILIKGYLARELKGDKTYTTFFHEWLMREKVEEFKEKNEIWGKWKVHIHHITFCKRINVKKYLKILTDEEHNKLHKGYYGLKYILDED